MQSSLSLVLTQIQHHSAHAELSSMSPQDCSLECILQGGLDCEYCRINTQHFQEFNGTSNRIFGSNRGHTDNRAGDRQPGTDWQRQGVSGCVPKPCLSHLGGQNSDLCQHYVNAPENVNIEFLADQNSMYDNIVVSWKPSLYGIGFLRGFQVFLQVLGGSRTACQLFLFSSNISLSASHAQTVFKSDPFYNLDLGAQYAVTVLPLPAPENWKGFYKKKLFFTRTCPQKNGLENCKEDWYPKYINVQQKGLNVTVTFNLAPTHFGISSYFCKCYGREQKEYTIELNLKENQSHSSLQLDGLEEGSNYTCEIAADQTDAVRKLFTVYVMKNKKEPQTPYTPSSVLSVLLPIIVALAAILLLLLLAVTSRKRPIQRIKYPGITKLYPDKCGNGQHVSLITRVTPPRLLICYSSDDGPAHIRAVVQLAAFLQQHMATQVFLDLWDSHQLAEDGIMGWYCSRIHESDFVLVICSRGLQRRPSETVEVKMSAVAIALVAEEVCRAKAKGEDISKYMAAVFEYSDEKDIPAELGFVSRYTLARDFSLLFSHIHGVALHRPGECLRIEHISGEGYTMLPAGAALQCAIQEAGMALRNHQDTCGKATGQV
ncbi:hypothetical protein UPYG_G00004930 [Umbra pygmaea]|uniref:SEFIR domain-containing protein n=1 Tax=Umbra pygmaea TaxID=75934 RepID=A0ABD0XH86_UMBPY